MLADGDPPPGSGYPHAVFRHKTSLIQPPMTFHVKKTEPLSDGLRRIAREQIRIVLGDFDDGELSIDKRVHSLRARCKKMRALLQLPGPLMGAAYDEADARFRDAGKRLSGYRDAHVMSETLALVGETPDSAELEEVSVPASVIENSVADMQEALADVDDWPLEVMGFCDIAPGFAKTYRKCRAAWDSVGSVPSDERFHKLRKWSKYHWYHVRILERVNKAVLRERRFALRDLAKILGGAHDLAVLEITLGQKARPDKKLIDAASKQKRERYATALKIGCSVFEPSTDMLVADLSKWWAAWRCSGSQ